MVSALPTQPSPQAPGLDLTVQTPGLSLMDAFFLAWTLLIKSISIFQNSLWICFADVNIFILYNRFIQWTP